MVSAQDYLKEVRSELSNLKKIYKDEGSTYSLIVSVSDMTLDLLRVVQKCQNTKFYSKSIKLNQDGYIFCGIGAGAKSNTFLSFYGLNNKVIKFLTDSSKFKQNKFTPLTRILIKDDREIAKHKKIACLILSWNISDIVINKIKKINKNIKLIKT